MRKFLCWIGIHRWERWEIWRFGVGDTGKTVERLVCPNCRAAKEVVCR
jgi:hypothetical protein